MAHRYGHPISVTLVSATGRPQSFLWRGRCYRVAEVFSIWRLCDRWWERPAHPAAATAIGSGASDRTYYRVRCPSGDGEQLFDLYHDVVTDRWVLDCAHD